MWNGCREMRDRERKERGEILDEDGKRYGKGGSERKKKEMGDRQKNVFFLELLFLFLDKTVSRVNKALYNNKRILTEHTNLLLNYFFGRIFHNEKLPFLNDDSLLKC
jgi:hypothetical protein